MCMSMSIRLSVLISGCFLYTFIPIVFFITYSLIGKFLYYNSEMTQLKALDFEVFAKIHSSIFRKYIQEEAKSLNLVGWCSYYKKRTVIGHIQGPADSVEAMKLWLSIKGNPKSLIKEEEFKNEGEISALTFEEFQIRK